MRPIPYHAQIDDHTCGPASVQMALAAFGVQIPQEQLDSELETPRDPTKGTDPQALVRVVSEHGLVATVTEPATLNDAALALERDEVVIICYTEPGGEGHYALIGAIDRTHVTLVDPSHGPQFKLAREVFERDWRDSRYTQTNHWMLCVSQKNI